MKKTNKKGAVSLQVEFIVIAVLALVFVSLGIYFIRSNLERSQIKLEEVIVVGAPKPQVEIQSPHDGGIYEVEEEVNFEPFSYGTKSKIVGYFWDFDGDGNVDSRNEETKHTYYEPGDHKVILKVLNDLGGVGESISIVRIYTKNEKNMTKYDKDLAFFIPYSESSNPLIDVENWREILMLVPLARWFDQEGDHNNDFVVLAKGEGENTTSSDIKDRLDDLGKTDAVLFDFNLNFDIEGYTVSTQDTSDIVNYFSYWSEYDSVVLVDYNNDDGALIASLFAAYYNAPLVFISESNYLEYRDSLFGKKFYIIDSIPDVVTQCYIGANCPEGVDDQAINDGKVEYTSEELRDTSRRVNRIMNLSSKVYLKDEME
ncbi:MAG: PKD domain-containing protein [Nanoarchaeota archaeon]|nr:PKD domain-containing protein [Nanoarchaeota archaeon]